MALLLLSNFVATARAAAADSHVEQVIVVFKTHFDIGYTDMASNVVQRYRTTMIDQALQVVEQSRESPAAASSLAIIPRPTHVALRSGSFVLTKKTSIYHAATPAAAETARYLAEALRPATGFRLRLVRLKDGTLPSGGIVVRQVAPDAALGQEGYRLTVTPQSVVINSASSAGLFYGVQTLRQLLPPAVFAASKQSGVEWTVPAVEINDQPRYPWRGSLLDLGRHYLPFEFLKKYIDLLALHKMNRLQLHLTDDQGWRLEIKKYPRLTQVGSFRKESPKKGDRNTGDGTPYGPYFYTQAQMRELVAYAQARHVTIVPEIEMPGHFLGALAAHPEFSCTGGPFEVRTRWGIEPNILCAGNDAAITFAQDVLSEVIELFPSQFIHIGGDEAPKDRWKKCVKCQARIKAEGLKDEHELQSYFVRRMDKFIASRGRRLIGWDEILEGGLAPGATVMSWRGIEGGIAAANTGHDVVMSPTSHCYFDYAQAKGPGEPEHIGAFLPLATVYSYEPTPPDLPADKRKHILGAQGNVWGEYLWTPADVEYFAFPRVAALAEVVWSPAEAKNYDDFLTRLATHVKRLDALKVNYRKLAPEPDRPAAPATGERASGDPRFVWTVPGWPMHKILEDWPGQTTERKQKVLRAFKEGRFAVHALPFSTHTELLEVEDLVRGLSFASHLSLDAGLELPRDAKMTDVPCHSWILPTLLRHAGVDILHLGCNAASSSPEVPPLFWWEGPDGSRLLTMYSAGGYGTGLVPPKDWPHKTWLALIHTGDNHGPPTPDEVKKLLGEAQEKLPGVKVRIGRLSDFADALLAEKPNLPVIRGDMPDTWIHGPMCDPAGAKIARNIRPAIAATEALRTHLRAWELDVPRASPTIAAAYEQSLLYGEHTWGGALYWVTQYSANQRLPYGDEWKTLRKQGKYDRLEGSWAEHTAYIETAQKLIQPALDADLRALAQAVKLEGRRIVVFNPLPWKRDGVATVTTGLLERGAYNAVRPLDGGRGVALLELSGGTGRFVARDIPAMGYRTFQVFRAEAETPPTLDPALRVVESPFFKATLDPARGSIRSLVDKRSGRELVDASAPHGFGQYLYERFSTDEVQRFVKAYVKISADWATNELGKPNMPPSKEVPYRAASPENCTLSLAQNAVAVTAVMEGQVSGEAAHKVTTRLILYRDLPYADLEVTLHNKPADPWPEAGWICLPFKVDAPQFRLGRLGSIIDPAKDLVPGANRHLLALNTGLTITDAAGRGVGLCALDNPLVSLEAPGCWQYSRDFVPQKPAVFVNLFNNQWTTNFRLWNDGTWTARVRLWAIERYHAESGLITPSEEARFPLLAVMVDGAGGGLPPTQSGLELSRRGVLVTAFGPNPDGEGVLLRLWEHAGKSGHCRVRLPAGLDVKTVQPIDLRGRPLGKPRKLQGRSFAIDLPAFAPVTLRLDARAP